VPGDYITLRGKWRTSNAKEQRRKPVQTATALRTADLVLGRYRPLRPLGSGGSGSVWLVRDEEAGRDVALKVVERTGKAGSRAKREVDAATRLRHPRCLRALAFHRDDGHVYVAYEYVRGKNLREALRAGKVDDATAIEVAAQVLDALAHAHAKGIVHRDVKPANVMVEDCDEVSTRLLDFGLARLDELEGLTATGDVPGTLAYVAPERLEGEPAGGAADVWGVGVMLWEALAGWHPFAATSPVETARRIAAGAPRLAAERPDLPREVCAAVDSMLSVEPRRRPPARRLAADLRAGGELRVHRPHSAASRTALRERAAHALLAALFAGGATTLLPFFPRGWPLVLAALAGLAALRSPIVGLAIALAAPLLPLGNLSLGLAIAYGVLACAWLALHARDAERSLLPVAAPLLAPFGAIPLLPVALLEARGRTRRAIGAAACIPLAAAVSVLAGRPLPFAGESPGSTAPVAGSTGPLDVTATLYGALTAHPTLAVAAVVLAFAAASADLAVSHGRWAIAAWGAALLGSVLLVPTAFGGEPPHALSTTLFVWAATCLLALRGHRSPDSPGSGRMPEPGERPT
jgi:eukaryotic-like serine/threonine-protein kinase